MMSSRVALVSFQASKWRVLKGMYDISESHVHLFAASTRRVPKGRYDVNGVA
ncbi:unnamed protein product [Prunus armeniaca]